MKSKTVILDAGHAGLRNGHYATPGKRSTDMGYGVLYEGAFNRWVMHELMRKLDMLSIPYYVVSDYAKDVSLNTRANRVNAIYKENPNVYLLSIHANAGGGTGIEAFTTRGETESDSLAELLLTTLKGDLQKPVGGMKFREDYSDGDADKEADFTVIKRSKCPGILLECGFMDHPEDYKKLWSIHYHEALANSIRKFVEKVYYS